MPAPMPPHDGQMQELKQMVERALTKIDQIKEDLPRTYVSRADYERGQEALEENTRHISEKLDKLTDELPNRFLDRLQYTTGHDQITKRVETNELRVEDLRKEVGVNDKRVTELYANGMAWANATITEIRDLIVQNSAVQEKQLSQIQISDLQRKDDARRQMKNQVRVVLLSVFLGALLAFASTIILHAIHVL